MNAAPRHVDRLDLRSRGLANRLIIAVADGEIVADRTAEAREAQHQLFHRVATFLRDGERQPPVLHGEGQIVRAHRPAFHRAQRLEAVFLDQIENGDAPLLLDIGIAPDDRIFVQFDPGDAEVRWGRRR